LSGPSAASILAAAGTMKLLAKQMSIGRKLFRFGRSVHCLYMMRSLLEEKNTFLQVIGLNSWFWNAMWFLCDHVAWLKEINAIQRDPIVPLNRLSGVLMQVFQFLFNARQLALYYEEEARLLEELHLAKTKTTSKGRSKSAEDVGYSTVYFDPKLLHDPLNPVDRIEKALDRVRLQRRQLIPAFIKVLSDVVICFDFGFQWNLPDLFLNLCGVIGGLAGCYSEIETATRATKSKIEQLEKGQLLPAPPRR
jgi:hypothetical protein